MSSIGEDNMLAKLFEQQGQMLTLLTTVVQQTKAPEIQPPTPVFQQPVAHSQQYQQPNAFQQQNVQTRQTPQKFQQLSVQMPVQQQIAQTPVQQTAQKPQLFKPPSVPITSQTSTPPVLERSRTPTLLELLDTTDEELEFLNSPSWLSSDIETGNQTAAVLTPLAPLPPLATDEGPSSSYGPTVQVIPSSYNTQHYQSAGGQSSFQSPVNSPVPLSNPILPPPPFSTPPKLVPVDQVMKNYPGESVSALRKLAGALARDAIFGREELRRSSLRGGGKNNTGSLDKEKLQYIKSAVRTRLPTDTSPVLFEAIWDKCRSTISRSCQLLWDSVNKKKDSANKKSSQSILVILQNILVLYLIFLHSVWKLIFACTAYGI